MSETLVVRRDGAIAELCLQRPERLNSLDVPSFERFRQALEEVALDTRVRAVILTGAGRAFCAGGDVAAMEESRLAGTLPEFFHQLTGEQERAVRLLGGMAKPVVAALPGVAAGGGLSLALSCDWRIAAEGAVLVPAFPALGAVPDGGLSYFLPHYLGLGLAQEFLFTNARIPAERARELGLLHEVLPADRLSDRAWERARELSEGPTFAYGEMKRLLLAAFHEPLEAQLTLERHGAVAAARGTELPEGIRAFHEKRRPRFPPPS
ncbi:MAG: enoyl-CoA hydratase-related protein [Thermoplasmata archaeon]|nr:enoyl-CoA hydratase-related protein [Thermoplasmata archaeon]